MVCVGTDNGGTGDCIHPLDGTRVRTAVAGASGCVLRKGPGTETGWTAKVSERPVALRPRNPSPKGWSPARVRGLSADRGEWRPPPNWERTRRGFRGSGRSEISRMGRGQIAGADEADPRLLLLEYGCFPCPITNRGAETPCGKSIPTYACGEWWFIPSVFGTRNEKTVLRSIPAFSADPREGAENGCLGNKDGLRNRPIVMLGECIVFIIGQADSMSRYGRGERHRGIAYRIRLERSAACRTNRSPAA